jgi:hypothetical protein
MSTYSELIGRSLLLLPVIVVGVVLGVPLSLILAGWCLWGMYCISTVYGEWKSQPQLPKSEMGTHWSDHMREARVDQERQRAIDAAKADANMDEVYQKIGDKLGDSNTEETTMEDEETYELEFSEEQFEFLTYLMQKRMAEFKSQDQATEIVAAQSEGKFIPTSQKKKEAEGKFVPSSQKKKYEALNAKIVAKEGTYTEWEKGTLGQLVSDVDESDYDDNDTDDEWFFTLKNDILEC